MITGDMEVTYILRHGFGKPGFLPPLAAMTSEGECLLTISAHYWLPIAGKEWWPPEVFSSMEIPHLGSYRECKPVYSGEHLVAFLLRHFAIF